MTRDEQKSIDSLHQLANMMRAENEAFRGQVKELTDALSKKVEAKLVPIYFERDILGTLQTAMNKAIENTLIGYSSPLVNIVANVVTNHSSQISAIIDGAFTETINKPDFAASIRDAFSHKIAKSIISMDNGLLDKVTNDLRQDTVFRAKVTQAIANVVTSCMP